MTENIRENIRKNIRENSGGNTRKNKKNIETHKKQCRNGNTIGKQQKNIRNTL